jgi:hypothetical protein
LAPQKGYLGDDIGYLYPNILLPWIVVQSILEITQAYTSGVNYLSWATDGSGKDLSNLFDWIRITMMIIYTSLHQSPLSYSLLVLASGANFLQYLNLFGQFRVFNELFGSSFYRIRYFVAVLAVLVVSFYGCFMAYLYISNGAQNAEFWRIFQITFLFTFGDFGPAEGDELAAIWMIFALMTVTVTLVMMNLLIALVSDEYNVVMAEIKDIEGQMLCSMILQFESYMIWNRGKN